MKMILRTLVFVTLLVSAPGLGYSQDRGSFGGKVRDAKTGTPLYGASIYIKGTHIGNISDANGKFLIPSVPAGKQVIVCSMMGYRKIEEEIAIGANQTVTQDFNLVGNELPFSEVVVTATRNAELTTSVSASTEVLNTKVIEESNAKNVGEALRSVGASFVKSYGATGALESISLRGSTSAQVLILIDGQRMNNAQAGSVDLSSIPLDAVDRIEVVKGGNTAMYGSDAVGGVVNIITKPMVRKNTLDFSASGLYGTYNTKIADLSLSQGAGNFDYFASYNRTQSAGNYEYTNDYGTKVTLANGDTKSDNVFVKGGYLFGNQSRISAFFKYRYADNGSPGSIQFPDTLARQKTRSNHYSITYDQLTLGPFAFSLNAYVIDEESRYIDPQSYLGLMGNRFDNVDIGAILQVCTDLHRYGLLSYGYEYRQDRLQSNEWVNQAEVPYIGDHQRGVNSLFLQDDWKYHLSDTWTASLVPAIRLDAYPEKSIGSQFSPKLGFTISNDDVWRGTIRGNLGRVYRAPTYNDLYWPEDTWDIGNPNLKPESGTTYDLGVVAQFHGLGDWNIEETYFGSRMNDLILWESFAKWMPVNVDKAKTDGLESRIGWTGFDRVVEIEAAYTYMSAKDNGNDPTTSGKYLIYSPKDKFDLNVNLSYGIGSLNLYYNYVGKRFNDPQNTVALGSYSMLSANVGITPRWQGLDWTVRVEGNNLANKEIQIVRGSPVPGREIRLFVGIRGSILTGSN